MKRLLIAALLAAFSAPAWGQHEFGGWKCSAAAAISLTRVSLFNRHGPGTGGSPACCPAITRRTS